jgi:hypothetical protein
VKTLTIEIDDEICAFVQEDAARIEVSVSQYIGALLYDCMKQARDYEEARKAFFALPPLPRFEFPGGRPPTRDEIYGD